MRKILNAEIYLCFIVLFPCFFGYLGLNTGQMLYLLVVTLIPVFEFITDSTFFTEIVDVKNIQYVIIFLLLCCEYFISTIMNFGINSYFLGDFIEILRPIVYLWTYISSLLVMKPVVKQKGCDYVFDLFENIVFAFSIFEFLKFFRPAFPFFALYSPFSFGSINFIRMSGTTGFAYSYAWILGICLFLNVRKHQKMNFKSVYYILLILLTGSRTGAMSLVCVLFFIFIFYRKSRRTIILSAIFISALIIFLYAMNVEVVKISIDYIIRLVKALLLGKGSDGSLSTRTRQNQIAMQNFDNHMLLGIASNKAQNITIENFYFHHLRNWGILGIILYVICLFVFYFQTPKEYKKLIFIIIFTGLIISFSSPIFDQIRNFNIMYFFFASVTLGHKVRTK